MPDINEQKSSLLSARRHILREREPLFKPNLSSPMSLAILDITSPHDHLPSPETKGKESSKNFGFKKVDHQNEVVQLSPKNDIRASSESEMPNSYMIFVANDSDDDFVDISHLDQECLGAIDEFISRKQPQEINSSLMFVDGEWVGDDFEDVEFSDDDDGWRSSSDGFSTDTIISPQKLMDGGEAKISSESFDSRESLRPNPISCNKINVGHSSQNMLEFVLSVAEKNNFKKAGINAKKSLPPIITSNESLLSLLNNTNTLTENICQDWIKYTVN